MDTSTFDPCLLISSANNDNFALIGMQTDDTIGLTDKPFSERENVELEKATFTAKPKQFLETDKPITFNGGVLSLHANGEITLCQKGQGLRFQLLDLTTAKLYVFSNDNEPTEQTPGDTGSFTVNGNIVYFSSTKCKRVTRSVLASEIYAMVVGADIAYVIRYPRIPTVICTDSYSLYECL
ncbi:hypothetical protein LX36DRAFT_659952, partial [Colletotrichum falcatum]